MEILFVTGNPKKFSEVDNSISNKVILNQIDLGLDELQTNSLEEISKHKALQAFQKIWKPLIVEDTWLIFDAYDNFPWAFTKFMYQSLWFEGLQKLLDNKNNSARFKTVLSYADKNWDIKQFIGEIEWTIKFDWNLTGEIHMPYNYIFHPENSEVPAIKMYDEWKYNNHRSRAVQNFNEFINNLI